MTTAEKNQITAAGRRWFRAMDAMMSGELGVDEL
jgi:hypothetical protein